MISSTWTMQINFLEVHIQAPEGDIDSVAGHNCISGTSIKIAS